MPELDVEAPSRARSYRVKPHRLIGTGHPLEPQLRQISEKHVDLLGFYLELDKVGALSHVRRVRTLVEKHVHLKADIYISIGRLCVHLCVCVCAYLGQVSNGGGRVDRRFNHGQADRSGCQSHFISEKREIRKGPLADGSFADSSGQFVQHRDSLNRSDGRA